MPTRDDATLVAAVLAGERAAFGLLYDRYAPLARAICWDATHDLAEAQDLAQDVFVRGFEGLANLRERERFGQWLVGIARLRCREWQRGAARHRRRGADLAPDDIAAPDAPPGDDLEDLRRAVAALPEQERLALHVFYLQERPVEAAQQALGLSRSGFYRVLERARHSLKRLLCCSLEDIQ